MSGDEDTTTTSTPAVKRPMSRAAARLRRDQRVRRMARRITRECAWLTPADGPIVIAWSQLEVLAREAYERLRADGLLGPGQTVHPLLPELTRLRRAQLQIAGQLGLGPRARAELQAGPRPLDMDGVFERIQRAHKARHGEEVEEVEDVETPEQG